MDDLSATSAVLLTRTSKWLRRLRIAVSVFFAVVTIALCVLWVRSYWWMDTLRSPTNPPRFFLATSFWGQLYWEESVIIGVNHGTTFGSMNIHRKGMTKQRVMNEYINDDRSAPYWVLALTAASITVGSSIGLKWRFSLRTMLIATTLVAVVLGLGVWLAR